jgi:transcriptional regulator with XRE-family HTH domain
MAVTVGSSPFVERRRLRAELRQARQDAGLTQETVAEQMDWSLSKIIRIETGSVGISTNDLTALLRLYKIKDRQQVRELLERAKVARQHAWWSKYRNVLPKDYFQYIEYETSASIIRSYQTIVVPGLLQTEEYAAATARLYRLKFTAEEVRARVEVRMKRQERLLSQSQPPLLFYILDEAVVQRLLGDQNLRQAQLEKLISMAERPEITIEIVPFAIGLHRGMAEDFNVLEFPDSADNDVI